MEHIVTNTNTNNSKNKMILGENKRSMRNNTKVLENSSVFRSQMIGQINETHSKEYKAHIWAIGFKRMPELLRNKLFISDTRKK